MPKYTPKKQTPKKKPCCLSKDTSNTTDLTFANCCMGCTKPTKGTQMFINNKLSCKCLNHTKFCKECLQRWLNKESNLRQCPICKVEGISEIKCLETNKKFTISKPEPVEESGHSETIFQIIRALSSGHIHFQNTRRNQRLIIGEIEHIDRRRIVNDVLRMIDNDTSNMVVRFDGNHRAMLTVTRTVTRRSRLFR